MFASAIFRMKPDERGGQMQSIRTIRRSFAVSVLILAACHAPTARAESDPVPSPSASQPGAALYAQRCAQCHDHPVDRIPPRTFLTIVKTPDQVVTALISGPMQPQAAGLSA